MWYVRGVEELIATSVVEGGGQTRLIWKCSRKVNGQYGVGLVVEAVLVTAPAALGLESTGISWASRSCIRAIINPKKTSLSLFFCLG